MRSIVLLFPGQGSQVPGMGKDLAAAFPQARDVFEAVDVAAGAPLTQLCFNGPVDELTLTHNAQPALLAHGAAVWAVMRDQISSAVVAGAGHSLGEFTAYHAADALSLPDAIALVRQRGRLMLEAGEKRPGTMAAILGDTSTSIDAICDAASIAGVVVPANFNSPGQVVISGSNAGVEKAMELAREAGAKRAIKLNVSGAFHSPLMADAAHGLAAALDLAPMADPRFPIYSNVNAQAVDDAALARRLLIEQLTSPVQWTKEATALAAKYADAVFVEMGPGTVLKGLMKKIAPDATVASCGTAADVDAVLTLVNA